MSKQNCWEFMKCGKHVVMFFKGWLACVGVVVGMFCFASLYVGAIFTFIIPLIPIWIGSVYFSTGIGSTIYLTCCIVVWCSMAGLMVLTET
jgi:hypothetical protein